MPKAPLPIDEAERLATLRAYDVLDSGPDAAFDDLARLAASIAGTPVSLVGLMDADRQWYKARVGTDLAESPRDISFCGWTILGSDLLVIPDATLDPRFADNPLVTAAPNVRFYAGTPIITPEGHAVGTLCVFDVVPRQLTDAQAEALRALGRQAVSLLRLRRAMATVARSEKFTRATIDALTSRVAVLDDAGQLLAANRAWRDAAATGADSPADAEALAAGVREVLAGSRDTFTLECALGGAEGERRWSVVRVSRFDDGSGRPRAVVCHEDVTDRHAAADRLRHDAQHDALTGLPNRVLFAERVDRCIALARRHGTPFAVLFLDLDRFKIINDSLGHAAGDRLLTTVATRLTEAVRPSDSVAVASSDEPDRDTHTVARMGGDEFTVLLEHLQSPADAARVAERIRAAIARPIEYDGHELTTTASIGIVACAGGGGGGAAPVRYEAAKDLLRDADAAMYKAKAAGKDRYVVFDQTMHAEVVTRMTLEADLRRAVGRGELEVHYQPIVALADGETVAFEALVRWRRGGAGERLVSPADFIPVAEDTGLIVPIGAWVLRRACQQLAAWRAGGGPMAHLYVTVNVSRRQLADAGLLATVQDALRETGLPPGAIVLEITESAIMDDPAAAERTLLDLRHQAGVRLSVDDFGTGYSSLSCLQRFPIDLLKIDRSFVQNVTGDRRDAAVMRTIVALAHDLEISVVAEGIERPEQAAFLAHARCDLTQGYLFSRPLEAAAAERFVRESAARLAA
jgi:diguanylate cyclase (GGDEF)-like protein